MPNLSEDVRNIPAGDEKRQENAGFLPFRSERCKLIDLAAWLDSEYRIPGEQQKQQGQKDRSDS